MIKINLLPSEYAQAQARRDQQLIAISVGSCLFIFLVGFWYLKSKKAVRLEQEIREAEAELRKSQAIISQIEEIETRKQQLMGKRDVIRDLNRSRLIYPVFFEDLLPIIPSDVWINALQIQDNAGQLRLSMNSFALSNFALATWLTNLQTSTHFSSIDLSPINYTANEQGAQTLSFTINCTYKHNGPFPLSEYN
jgi:type IV pilus assembly protein PilN